MTIKEAILHYYAKLTDVFQEEFGTNPTICYDEEINPELFISGVDEYGESQWKPVCAKPFFREGSCDELNESFSSYYFGQQRGTYGNFSFDIAPVYSYDDAVKIVEAGLKDGDYYFKGSNYFMLGTAEKREIDDYILIYRQENGSMFVYDTDKKTSRELKISLPELIELMEAEI